MARTERSSLELYPIEHLTKKEQAERAAMEARFAAFVHGVAPWLCLGHIHYDVCDWIQENYEKGFTHLLVLLPRGHLKSTLAYLWVCWIIIKNPAVTWLYASASHTLAEMQVNSIKTILSGDVVSHYWPGLLNLDQGKRKVWRQTEISVDHPLRDELGVRDFTVRAVAIGHGVTGSHCDELLFDDVVAPESDQYSPWTAEGRAKLETWSSFMSSVHNPEGSKLVIGTRYHAKDLYGKYMDLEIEEFDSRGEEIARHQVYKTYIKVVEEGGNFLWPRQQGPDGTWHGFNWKVLNKKKSEYTDLAKFYSQYYQNPIDPVAGKFVEHFQYYDQSKLIFQGRNWYIKTEPGIEKVLNVYAAVDIASTTNKDSDYTAIVVIGVDKDNNRYVLDIDRFKTDRISIIMDHIFNLYSKWMWKRLRIETTQAQEFVYTQLQDDMKRRNILFASERFKPQLRKPERILAVLEPMYKAAMVYHYRGGNCEVLESELVMERPPHDDISDALAAANEIAVRPTIARQKTDTADKQQFGYHSRFGGVN